MNILSFLTSTLSLCLLAHSSLAQTDTYYGGTEGDNAYYQEQGTYSQGQQAYSPGYGQNSPVPGQDGYVRMTEPNENAFTILMPKGWKASISLDRPGGQVRSHGQAMSPDGISQIFFGDPQMPMFMIPNPQMGLQQGMNTGDPMIAVHPYMASQDFGPEYVKRGFGQMPGFRITQVQANPQYKKLLISQLQKGGINNARISASRVQFTYQYNGQPIQGIINCATIAMFSFWMPSTCGLTTLGKAQQVEPILNTVMQSHQISPQWQQKENQRNQQKMAQSNAQHQQRMQNMQNNFNSHQQMMKSRYQASDQQYQQWQQNQASQDQQHGQFIDYINGQQNIGNGQTGAKVEAGYNYYYVNPNTNQYIGTDNPNNPDPNTYQEWNKKP